MELLIVELQVVTAAFLHSDFFGSQEICHQCRVSDEGVPAKSRDTLCPASVRQYVVLLLVRCGQMQSSLAGPIGEAALASLRVTSAMLLFLLQHHLPGYSDWDEDECRVHHAQSLQSEIRQDPAVQ